MRMPAVADEAAPLFEPDPIDTVRDVVGNPQRQHQQDADHERPSQKVMGVLAPL